MAIYNGTQLVKPSGMVKVYVGSSLVYEASGPVTPYRRLEYIQSSGATGGQYIDTLNVPTVNTEIEIQACEINTGTKHDAALCGARHPSGQFVCWYNDNNTSNIPIIGPHIGETRTVNLNFTYNTIATIKMNRSGATINGVDYPISAQTFNITNTMCIFAMKQNSNQVDSRRFTGNVYYFKIWESGTLVKELIPAQRKSDSAVGLYDTVNDVFYENLGTGSFVPGPIVEENWK